MIRDRAFAAVLAARCMRGLAYGSLSVVIGIALARQGFSSAQIGALLSLTLACGAAFSFAASALARRFGERATLFLGCALMAAAGTLLAAGTSVIATVAAFALGTVTAGAQEVGPFAALEQAIISEQTGEVSAARYALYNTVGILCGAVGAALVGLVALHAVLWFYAVAALGMCVAYATLPHLAASAPEEPAIAARKFGLIEQLAALFAVDALAGGFVVQAVISYWFHARFGTPLGTLGPLLAGANVLSGISFYAAARLAKRFGLLNTMVFTHLPSNVLLLLIPFMPSFSWAAAMLLMRFALSQMDVPTRQAYAMNCVAPHERTRAAALTNAVRPAAAAIAPLFAGLAMQTAAFGAPFVIAGAMKIIYDLTLFLRFRAIRAPATQTPL